jgi:hypothetical protein
MQMHSLGLTGQVPDMVMQMNHGRSIKVDRPRPFDLVSGAHSLVLVITMYIPRLVSVATILATVCIARPASNVDFSKAIVEKLEAAPPGWIKDSSVKLDKDSTSVTLRVHLVNQDMDKFHDLAMNVRPSHEQQHGQFEANTS